MGLALRLREQRQGRGPARPIIAGAERREDARAVRKRPILEPRFTATRRTVRKFAQRLDAVTVRAHVTARGPVG